jgi:hypothetical protein
VFGFGSDLIQSSLDPCVHIATASSVSLRVCQFHGLVDLCQRNVLGWPSQAIASIPSFACLDNVGPNQVCQHASHKDGVRLDILSHRAA